MLKLWYNNHNVAMFKIDIQYGENFFGNKGDRLGIYNIGRTGVIGFHFTDVRLTNLDKSLSPYKQGFIDIGSK